MNKCSAEELANRVLNRIKEKNGEIKYPIDPFKILKEENIFITFSDFENLSGIIIKDKEGYTIVGINKNTNYARQRYTAAHEYCHYLKDLNEDGGRIDCLTNQKSKIEKYAEEFASHLLMPTNELKRLCNKCKNKEGYVSFENITYLAEYFGVSFKACVYRIAYDLHMIDGDTTPKELYKRIQKYRPATKRKELIKNLNDKELLGNIINSLSQKMIETSSIVVARFLNRYIYNDNRIEGVNVPKSEVNYILADLYYNEEHSEFFNSEDENIIMTLGNYKLQEYVLTTTEDITIDSCRKMHSILHSYAAYPEYSGSYRTTDAVLKRGVSQPVTYTAIYDELDKIENKLKVIIKNKNTYSESEYIENIIPIIHRFTVIHPFSDGNGRVSRSLLNGILKAKNIPPIYVDKESKSEYLDALGEADKNGDYTKLIIYVEKRIINTLTEMHCYPKFS